VASVCAHCGDPLPTSSATGPRRFCSPSCRQRAYRRRHAGVGEDAYQAGARRGRVPLKAKTHAEEREQWNAIIRELRATRLQLQLRMRR